MRNNLIGSALIVFWFWYAVLFLLSGFPLLDTWMPIAGTLMIWAVGWPTGAVISYALSKARLRLARQMNGGWAETVKATVMADPKTRELVEMPIPQPDPVPRGKVHKETYDSLPWWDEYRRRHPMHARAMKAILEVMASKPGLPAAPNPGGHGGLSLFEHSRNVLNAMLELAPKWRYDGMRNSKGAIVVPVLDLQRGYHAFDGDPMNHPILFLAAMAHDIGKVECYAQDAPGSRRVREVKPDHGTVGAAMLRRMPEIMALPLKERDALLLAVSYYHHASHMPVSNWVGDMARSLTLLLYQADCVASVREGDTTPEKVKAAREKTSVPRANDEDDVPLQQPDVPDLTPSSTEDSVVPLPPPPAITETSAPNTRYADRPRQEAESSAGASDPPDRYSVEGDRTPLQVIEEILMKPGAINGKNAAQRVGFKHGEWLYLFEAKLRARAAELLGDPELAVLKVRGNMHPFTKEALREAEERGILMQEFGGQHYGHKRGLWLCRMGSDTQSENDGRDYIMMILRASILPSDPGDAKYPPTIVRNLWGETAAQNKARTKSDTPATDKPENVKNSTVLPPVTLLDLQTAAREMKIPFVAQSVDGKNFALFSEDILAGYYQFDRNQLPNGLFSTYGKHTQKYYIGVEI